MRDNRDRKAGNKEFSGRTCSRSNSRKGNPPGGTVELTPSTSYHLLVGRHPAEGPFRRRIYLQALTKSPTIDPVGCTTIYDGHNRIWRAQVHGAMISRVG